MNGLSMWATEAGVHWQSSEKPATETSNQAKESVHLLVSFFFEDSSARLINPPHTSRKCLLAAKQDKKRDVGPRDIKLSAG